MRIALPLVPLVLLPLVLLVSLEPVSADMPGFTKSELAELPRTIDGLTLHIRAAKDTLLLGEPITIEVFFHNAGIDTVRDPCKFHPYDWSLTFHAIRSDSEVVRIPQEIHRTGSAMPLLAIPPGKCAGTVLIFGSRGLITLSTARGPAEYPTQHFGEIGTHRIAATYYKDLDKGDRIYRLLEPCIVSNQDSFFVAEPTGWNKTVFEAIGDTLFSPKGRQDIEMPLPAWEWEKDPAFWERLCLFDSTSVYAPWVWAGRARCAFKRGREDSSRYEAAIGIMNELVRRFPGHRFSQEAEFNIAAILCFSGQTHKAAQRLDRLRRRYPVNVRAYETCGQDGQWGLRKDLTVSGTCEETP
jgi:hypothetical protein